MGGHSLHGWTFDVLGAATPMIELRVEERRLRTYTVCALARVWPGPRRHEAGDALDLGHPLRGGVPLRRAA
jgi:hypothetical protein